MEPNELDVQCPKCHAEAGRFCRMPSGGAARSHSARRRAWREQRGEESRLGVKPRSLPVALEQLVLAIELAPTDPAGEAADECADVLDEAATEIEAAAYRCDGGAYWMEDHAVASERVACPGCLALAGRLRARAAHLRAGAK